MKLNYKQLRLDKLQRHTMYLIMSAEVNRLIACDYILQFGLCKLFADIINDRDMTIEKLLPELHQKLSAINPTYNMWSTGLLFPPDTKGWQKRLELLEQCILETC